VVETVCTGTPLGGAPLLAVAIGASAGGPPAIERVLSQLPGDFPAPVLICQHMTGGATAPWAERLDECCQLRVVEASQGEELMPGRAYIAPIGRHMRVRGSASRAHLSLEPDRSGSQFVPSIDQLMLSVAEIFGSRSMGVLLTGMGSDGAQGMLAIRRAGGFTLAQSADTAFMRSMPSSAAQLGAVNQFAPLEEMAAIIAERVSGRV
jgi:two-component system chemotaxis response regulator CheB